MMIIRTALVLGTLVCCHAYAQGAPQSFQALDRHQMFVDPSVARASAPFALNRNAWPELQRSEGKLVIADVPLSDGINVDLNLRRFRVTGPDTKFVVGSHHGPDRPLSFNPDRIVLLSGEVRGVTESDVYLAVTDRSVHGHIDLGPGAARVPIAIEFDAEGQPVSPAGRRDADRRVTPPARDVILCGLDVSPFATTRQRTAPFVGSARATAGVMRGLLQIEMAVETDYEYYSLFDDLDAAATYIVEMYGGASHLYRRDVNTLVDLTFVRLWDTPDDLFNEPDPLSSFRHYWNDNMGHVERDVAQLVSGRRDFPYGGVAYLQGLCNDASYSVVGYILGFFPDLDTPDPYQYDIPVAAHELGHNCDSLHTPDYDPPIDTCWPPPIDPQRGTIMSYCSQVVSGGNAIFDARFHARVQLQMEAYIGGSECVAYDCNLNGVDDAVDIGNGNSDDANGNQVPDECEDCNDNGNLDDADISDKRSQDDNDNGIPDECEPDCNENGVPDELDIATGKSEDRYGNNIPDECERDCDEDGESDYSELNDDLPLDINRNLILDACEDCDDDGALDAAERASAHNAWVASAIASDIGEYHAYTGVLVKHSTGGQVDRPQDLIISPDGVAFVSSGVDHRVVSFDARSGAYLGDFVPAGNGGLAYPTGITIRANGNLLVSSRDTNSVLEYDGDNGLFEGTFVAPGAGGLVEPYGLVHGPDGHLYVTSQNDEVLKYDGATGAYIEIFVSADDNGPLSAPRGLTFKPDGNLLIAAYNNEELLEFDGRTGRYLGEFSNGGSLYGMWGVRVGPNGNIFATRDYGNEAHGPQQLHVTSTRIYEYDYRNGNLLRSFIVGDDTGLYQLTGFDFVPGWDVDCNVNFVQDTCDLAEGVSADANRNGVPDECEVDCNENGRYDRLDIIPHGTSTDCNGNRLPDECDIDDGTSMDNNGDDIPDECQFLIIDAQSLLVHGGVGPNEIELAIDLDDFNGVEPRQGGIAKLAFSLGQSLNADTVDCANIQIACANGPGVACASATAPDNRTIMVVLSGEAGLANCCTLAFDGVLSSLGDPLTSTYNVISLGGDVDGSGGVTGGDASRIKPHFGEVPGDGLFAPQFDFDRNAGVTGGDFSLIKPLFNTVAPACP